MAERVPPPPPPTNSDERTVGELVLDISEQTSGLIREEIDPVASQRRRLVSALLLLGIPGRSLQGAIAASHAAPAACASCSAVSTARHFSFGFTLDMSSPFSRGRISVAAARSTVTAKDVTARTPAADTHSARDYSSRMRRGPTQ